MAGLVSDTHAAVWYLLDAPKLSPMARSRMRRAEESGKRIYIPAICLVELFFLMEKGRLPTIAWAALESAINDEASMFRVVHLDRAIAHAMLQVPRAQVPEMPDRLIAATAVHLRVPLITRDHKIQLSGVETIW